jgi:hypothetical protein
MMVANRKESNERTELIQLVTKQFAEFKELGDLLNEFVLQDLRLFALKDLH